MIQEAARFAERVHEGKLRKGTRAPYIVHPLETAAIVSGMTEDEDVICAALLHDVIEDAGITRGELEGLFGPRVAGLVAAESEDKAGTWEERKTATVRHLSCASREVKLICLGDKVSNLRSTLADYLMKGDAVWLKFRETDKKKHEWYYRSVLAELGEFCGEVAYREYELLLRKLFG